MKKLFTVSLLLFTVTQLFAQSTKDTANNPYYLEMMQDRKVSFFQTVNAFNAYWQGRDSSVKGSGWKAFKRWEWHMRQIINNDGTYPDMQQWINDYYMANSQSFPNNTIVNGITMQSAATCKSKGDWKEIGPGFLPYNRTTQPSGVGRLNAVAFHPTDSNTLWVCAPAGGLWKSTNAGATWSSNTDSMPTLGTSALVISSRNTDTMYLGTGDRDAGDASGLGVYMSANAGKTWMSRNSGMGNVTVARLLIHPTNTKILLAATSSGIYRTTNSGGTWSQIVTGSYKDIVFNPLNPNTVYATRNGLFFRSTNCGQSWTQITSGLPTTGISRGAIAVTPSDSTYVYFLICDATKYYGTYRSTDGGVNFSTRSTTPNVMDYSTNGSGTGGQAWYDLDVACDPVDKDIFFVGGINIFKSTDGGATWLISAHWVGSSTIPGVHADQHNLEYHPITKKLYAANDGGIYFTPDKGTKWKDLSNGIGVSQLYKLGKSATHKDLMIGGFQDNGTAFFSGIDWNTVRGGDGMDCAWDRSNEDYSYGALYYGNITRFYKGVHDITVANNGVGGITETGDWVTPYCLRPDNTNTMFVGYKNIWRNTAVKSGTMTWTNITSNGNGNNIRVVENSPANPSILYYSRYDNTFFRSYNANGTASWVNLTSSLPATGTPSAIACHPTDSNMVFIGLNGRLYQSRNRGVSWTDISSGLPINRLNCIALDTSNSKFGIYVGTYTGVWFKDSTTTFSTFSSGLPINGSVTDLEIFYDKRHKSFNRLWGSTYARGTWKTALYDDGTKKPKTEFTAKLPKNCSDKTYTFTPECGYNPSNFKWLITPNTYNYQNSTDSLSEVIKVKFSKAGYYTVRLISENCNGQDTLTKQNYITIFDTIAVAANCKTTTTNLASNYGIGILNFELNGTVNASSGAYDDGSYMDYSCTKSFLLKPNSKYFTTVTTGPFNNEYVKIYIDYNNNGVFTDAGEQVYSTYNKTNHADTIRTPNTMVKNKMLRMRVLSDFNAISAACGTLSYGQSEDYGVFFDEPTPLFKVSKDSTCVNTSIIVSDATSGYGYNYTWNFGSGATPSTGTGKGPFNVKYGTSGYKKISMTINGSLSKSKDSAVLVLLTPSTSVFVKKGKTTQCEKDSITLAARDSKNYATSFQWQKTNAGISGAIDSLLKLWNNSTTVSGNYRVIASNGLCKDTTAAVTISINPLPKGGFTVNNLYQCMKGNQFIITDTTKLLSGSYKALYTYSNSTSDTNKIHNKSFNASGIYTVKQKVTTSKGCADSATKTLTVYTNTALGFNINDSGQCKNNNNFTFTNTSTISSGSFSSNWQYGNGNSSTGTDGSQSYAAYGNYSVSLITTSNNNCKDTLTRKVVVYPSPVAQFTTNNANQCLKGNRFIFTNTSTIGSGTLSAQWMFGDNTSSSINNPSKSYDSADTYTLTLIAYSNNNCYDSSSRPMTVYPNVKQSFNINDTDQCKNGNNFTFTNTSTVKSGTFSSNWLFGNGNVSGTTNATQNYAAHGSYTVTLQTNTNNGCKDTLIRKVIVFASPVTGFNTNDSDQCLRDNRFVFSNTSSILSGTMTYLWQFGDNTTSTIAGNISKTYSNYNTYKVQLTALSNNNCNDSIIRQVFVRPMPKAALLINDSSQCLPINAFSFTSQASIPQGTINNNWLFGDGNTSASTSPNHSYANAGNYTLKLIAISDFNCKDTFSKPLEVYSKPKAGFNLTPLTQCFKGNQVAITNTSTSAKTITSVFDLGNSATSSSNAFTYSYASAGNYRVTLKTSVKTGCEDTISTIVSILESPVAQFSMNDSLHCLNDNLVRFTNTSTPSADISNFWSYGDGLVSSNIQDSHHFTQAGNYKVELITAHNNGCNDTLSKPVGILEHPIAIFTVNDSSQCVNTNRFVFSNNSTGKGGLNATWTFGDISGSIASSPEHNYKIAGKFKVKLIASNSKNCKDSVSKEMLVFAKPNASFSIGTINQLTRSFSANIKKYPYYQWNFSDGYSSGDTVLTHTFSNSTNIWGQLVVQDSNACRDTSKQTFNVSTSLLSIGTGENRIKIYPNPSSTQVMIEFDLKTFGYLKYNVVDNSGRQIFTYKEEQLSSGIYKQPFNFEKMGLSPGIYLFEMETSSGKSVYKVIYQ